MHRGSTTLISVVLAGLLGSCAKRQETAPPIPEGEPARRVGMAFVHCIEAGSSRCVRSGLNHGPWDALYLLGWLGGGSPLSILEAFPGELREHRDPDEVQERFIRTVQRYGPLLRGAQCDPAGVQPLKSLVEDVADVAEERMQWFGLWTADMQEVVEGLTEEAKTGLGEGYLVRMRCKADPYRLYLAATPHGERYEVIGMTTALPKFLGGEATSREMVRNRLKSRSLGVLGGTATVREGTVHPWLDIPMEDF